MDLINKPNVYTPISGNDQYVYKASTFLPVAMEVEMVGEGKKIKVGQ